MGKKVKKRENNDKEKLDAHVKNQEKKSNIDNENSKHDKTSKLKEPNKQQNLNNKVENNKQNIKQKNKTSSNQDNKINNKAKKENIEIKDKNQEKITTINKQNKSSNKSQIKNVSNEKEIKKEPESNLTKDNNNINIKKEENKSNEEDLKEVEVNSKKSKGIKIKIIIIILIFMILIILGIFTIPAIIANNNNKIVSGISINGVNVEGLTMEEAKALLDKSANYIINSDVKIVLGEYENSINLSQISAKYDINNAIEEAYKIGRSDNIFKCSYDVLSSKYKRKNLEIGISINQEELKNVFNNISQELPGHVTQWSYSVNNDNTLIITNGTKGIVIDEAGTAKKIEESLLKSLNNEKIEKIDLVTKEVEPEPINVEKIHKEVYKEPQNAYVTQNPFGVYVHVNGVDFNVDEVKNLINSNNEHEYKINLTITEPEIKTKDLGQEAFPDILGRTYKTTYSAGDKNRNTNIEIAARTVNGIILMPGETFSYNGILGDTTANKGYKPAGAYLNGEVIQSYGGGICQVSSTIYNAVLYANLQVDERYNHTYLSGYVPAGLDATVSYGSKDFKFTNNRNYPIKLVCTAGNGTITATIYGIKQDDDCEVELQSVVTSYISPKVKYEETNTLNEGVEKVKQAGSSGCKCTVYRTVKRNGEQISKDVLHNDIYSAKQKIILKGTKKAGN